MLSFHYAPSPDTAGDNLSQRLLQELHASKRVLWLVPGGSNIPLSVDVMRMVPADLQPQLTIMLTDERYGEEGHADSNYRQLNEAGFDTGRARFLPVLKNNLPLEETCDQYAGDVHAAFGASDVVIGQFGIGTDGHIAGILPNSPAIDDQRSVVGYNAGQFTRITLTTSALQHVDIAFAFVFGDTKRAAVEQLQHQELPLKQQPSQLLKQLAEAQIYTDQVQENEIGGLQ